MAHLDISTFSGHQKSIELDKRQALSIGTHPSNDIQVEGDSVEIMHCRISWNKRGFEVVAAGEDGVDVNGSLVQKAQLEPGDVMRIGEADIRYVDESRAPAAAATQDDDGPDEFGLKPLSSEIDIPLPPLARDAPAASEPLTAEEIEIPAVTERTVPKRRKKDKRAKEQRSTSPEAGEARERDPRQGHRDGQSRRRERGEGDKGGERRELSRRESRRAAADAEPEFEREAPADAASEPEAAAGKIVSRSTAAAVDESFEEREAAAAPASETRARLRQRLHHPRRPGERDVARSPLVLSLGGGAAALVLIGLTFYLIIGRQTTQAYFDEAQALMDEGKYSQAIKEFDQFIALYPRDDLADDADIQRGIARIDRHTTGASPNWTDGLAELNAFISARRDLPDFEDHRESIRSRAELIAAGAAVSAGKDHNRKLLAVSEEARNLLTRYSPEDAPPADALKRIQTAWRASEAAILKYETLMRSIAAIDKALAAKRPMEALVERRELIRRYPDFETDRRVVAKLSEILKAEQGLITSSDEPIDAATADHKSEVPPPLVLTFHARSRTDEVSVGRTVFGVSKDCCYAVDSITGQPVWRRVIGWDTPFFPVPVNASVPALLLYAPRHAELQLVNQNTGELVWRQPAVHGVTGPPTVEEGQIYVTSAPGTLNKVDLASGKVVSRLTFSQKVVAPPAPILDGSGLLVAGSQEVLYTLTTRPLECVAVTYFGHKPGSVAAPMLPMGSLVLMCENQPGETSLLRVLALRDKQHPVQQIDAATIPGHVVDPPVIRGRDVFVPSSGERVSSFTASDEPGQPPLTAGPRYEPEGAEQSPMYLATGPDRQVWMASRYLRQLQLTTDAVQPGSRVVEIGIATQPIQMHGRKLYIGRAQKFSTATTLFQTDRVDLTSDWQTVVGARLLGWGSYPQQDGLVAVNETGDVFRISDAELDTGGFLSTTTVRLKLPDGLEEPLAAMQLSDGAIAAWCGDPQPQLWIINRVGQADRPVPLPGPLQCPPTLLGDRLLLPVAGRLHLLRSRSGQSQVQDFSLPQAADATQIWRQVLTVDETTAIAATQAGELILVRLQTSPQPFLAEAGRVELGQPLEYPMAMTDGLIALAAGAKLQLIDAATLEPRAQAELREPISNPVWMDNEHVFVETGRSELHVFGSSGELANPITIALEGIPLSGAPLAIDGHLLIPQQNGMVLIADAASGKLIGRKVVGQSLEGGPRRVSKHVVVATVDGSLTRLGSPSDGE